MSKSEKLGAIVASLGALITIDGGGDEDSYSFGEKYLEIDRKTEALVGLGLVAIGAVMGYLGDNIAEGASEIFNKLAKLIPSMQTSQVGTIIKSVLGDPRLSELQYMTDPKQQMELIMEIIRDPANKGLTPSTNTTVVETQKVNQDSCVEKDLLFK